jgi:hypothetical protein
MKLHKKTIGFLEFAIMGVLMGMVEDSLVVYFVTGETITFGAVWIVLVTALPFAFISEYIVDHPKFWSTIKIFKKEDEN